MVLIPWIFPMDFWGPDDHDFGHTQMMGLPDPIIWVNLITTGSPVLPVSLVHHGLF
jgi:hypothetical protein